MNADDDSISDKLVAARPESPRGIARQIGLEGVLAAVVGDRGPPTIGRYRVETRVGEGGMGVVYRARDDEGSTVAIKLLDAPVAHERARFGREARLLREVAHPNVVAYLEHGVTQDDVDYLVMEWLDGRDLSRHLQARGPLPVADALRVVLAAARGLGAVHRAGIVHRDVKPSNLFLVDDALDAVRVVDFGVSRAISSETQLTVAGAMVGTPSYAAPEQIRGLAGPSADVYGLGGVLFECLSGRPPYVGEHAAAILSAVVSEPVPSITSFRSDVPTEIDLLVGRMLAKRPEDRPHDMQSVALAVASLLAEQETPGPGRRVLSRLEKPTPRRAHVRGDDAGGDEKSHAAEFVAVDGVDGSERLGREGLVGRERELALVHGAIAESHANEEAVLIDVLGARGLGKTTLLDVLAPSGHVVRLTASKCAGPFALVDALSRAVAAHDPSCADATARFAECLDETRSFTADPLLVADRIVLAWLDLLDVAVEGGVPWTVVLDDAEHVDVPSSRLLARGLSVVDARPFAFVVARRPETVLPFAEGFDAERRTTVELRPLRARAAVRLAARAHPQGDEAAWQQAASLGGGIPARVIACAVSDRHVGAVEPTHDGLADEVLDTLDPEVRRILRAAAIVGQDFDVAVVAGLAFAEVEYVERQLSRAPDVVTRRPTWQFVSEAVHAVVHARCTDDDRRAGHLAVAGLLQSQPRVDLQALTHHLRAAGELGSAAPHHLALARAALAGGDTGAFDVNLACAREGAPDDPRIDGLDAVARFWRGDIPGAREAAARAFAQSPVGSVERFVAASQLVTCAGQLGDDTTTLQIAESAAEEAPRDDAARSARFVVLARAVSQRFARPDPTLDAHLDALRSEATTPEAKAWLHRVEAIRAREHLDAACAAHEAAHRAHAEHGDWRSAAQSALYLGSYRVWAGASERARDAVDEALRLARRLGADYLITWGRYVEAKLLVELHPEQALLVLDDVLTKTASSPRMHAGAQVYASLAAHRLGDFERATHHAERARVGTGLARVANAALVRAWVALERQDEARALLPTLAGDAREPELDELVRLATSELDPDSLTDALARIEARAATIEDSLRRDQYLTRPHLVVATRAAASRMSA